MSVFRRREVLPDAGQPPSGVAVPVRLLRARRWVRMGRVGMWAALAAGPAALLLMVGGSPDTAPVTKESTAPRKVRIADPSGYAELFVTLWLRSDGRSEGSTAVRRIRAMAPGVDLPEPRESAQPDRGLERVTAVRSARLAGGAWSVTVAAQFSGGQVRYFAVPLVVSGGGGAGAFAVTTGPARVAGPSAARVPESAYGVSVPEGSELVSTAADFLSAYLTGGGTGEVERYLAPGLRLAPVGGSLYERVEVEQVSADDAAAKGSVPPDGTAVRVQVRVRAVDQTAAWPLVYSLRMSARAGRWEIASLSADQAGAVRAHGAGFGRLEERPGAVRWAWAAGGAR
ncbi:conjugal transfer protein [Streptomyces sp. BRA346]|uniref:conjugal transfer protein n=1 Tax=Streptomyces sp. BRA346 TaxID=2878199 RepID=UPI004063757D